MSAAGSAGAGSRSATKHLISSLVSGFSGIISKPAPMPGIVIFPTSANQRIRLKAVRKYPADATVAIRVKAVSVDVGASPQVHFQPLLDPQDRPRALLGGERDLERRRGQPGSNLSLRLSTSGQYERQKAAAQAGNSRDGEAIAVYINEPSFRAPTVRGAAAFQDPPA